MTDGWSSSGWPRAAVFDCDGLLVESATCWQDAYAEITRAAGRQLADIDLAALTGASVAGAVAQLRRELGGDLDEATLRNALRANVAIKPLVALPGARELVRVLSRRMPLAVASNAPRDIVLLMLKRVGLGDAFLAVISAEETAAHKPAPDVYLEACRRLEVDPSDALAFEDSPLGVTAARRAGLVVVGVPSAPRLRLDADLLARRLDDPRVLSLLSVRASGDTNLADSPRSRVEASETL